MTQDWLCVSPTMYRHYMNRYDYQYDSSIYDPSRYMNMYPTTKETTPVTSNTLNDMSISDLEALAERTANTLKEKKAASIIAFDTEWESYRFNKQSGELTLSYGGKSVYQPIVKAFLDAGFKDTKGAIRSLNTIFTAITPTK